MESWLLEVEPVRIPRPKIGCGKGGGLVAGKMRLQGGRRPQEPPKDYHEGAVAQLSPRVGQDMENLRRSLEEKL
uniref:Putative secreted protein n=1 Tax=Xenopsylla cheopis TaxID=163159 RepID=A0A6M2DF56_XENCH